MFYQATAELRGADQVLVSSPKVSRPAAVRYAWCNACETTLASDAGLPVIPFRTDAWEAPAGGWLPPEDAGKTSFLTDDPAFEPLFATMTAFRGSWPKRGWSWDTRFSCVASAFSAELADEANTALTPAFPHRWNHKTLTTAPPVIQQIAERTGGVRADQWIYSTNSNAGAVIYALWWPWGDDTTITLRIGVPTANPVLEDRLREVFGAGF